MDASLAAAVRLTTSRFDLHAVIDIVLDASQKPIDESWSTFARDELTGPPFSDLGASHCIRFSALGTDWTIRCANDRDSVRGAERLAAGAQVMLAALAREDLCLIPTQITVKVELIPYAVSEFSESVEALPSNDGRRWVARLTPAGAAGSADPEEMELELLTMLTMILREASLLPEDAFSTIMDRAYRRGLGHKLLPARPYDELAAAFSTNPDDQLDRTGVQTPWDSREGSYGSHEELEWQQGPGPTYSTKKADELLHIRYDNFANNLRLTAVMLRFSPEFQPTIRALRDKGWLDWHTLTAILNIVMKSRFRRQRHSPPADVPSDEMTRAIFDPESATAEQVPVSLFSMEAMQEARQFAMLDLLERWRLELHQETPDIPAVERLLAARYGYWDNDVSHDDPFP